MCVVWENRREFNDLYLFRFIDGNTIEMNVSGVILNCIMTSDLMLRSDDKNVRSGQK